MQQETDKLTQIKSAVQHSNISELEKLFVFGKKDNLTSNEITHITDEVFPTVIQYLPTSKGQHTDVTQKILSLLIDRMEHAGIELTTEHYIDIYGVVESNSQTAIDMIKRKGVISKLATYTILQACSSKRIHVFITKAIHRWLEEKQTFEALKNLAREKYTKNKSEAATFFALHVLYYLQFGTKGWEISSDSSMKKKSPSCPYTTDAMNFIVTLTETGGCQCHCYTNYVRAMAEEHGFEEVYGCGQDGHINIMVVDPTDTIDITIKNNSALYETIGEHNVKAPQICTVLDAGYRENMDMKICTVDDTFKEKYNLGNIEKNLIISQQETISCTKTGLSNPTANKWNALTSVFNHILTRDDPSRFEFDIELVEKVWGIDCSFLKDTYRELVGKWQVEYRGLELENKLTKSLTVVAENFESYPVPEQVNTILKSVYTGMKSIDTFFDGRILPNDYGSYEEFLDRDIYEPIKELDDYLKNEEFHNKLINHFKGKSKGVVDFLTQTDGHDIIIRAIYDPLKSIYKLQYSDEPIQEDEFSKNVVHVFFVKYQGFEKTHEIFLKSVYVRAQMIRFYSRFISDGFTNRLVVFWNWLSQQKYGVIVCAIKENYDDLQQIYLKLLRNKIDEANMIVQKNPNFNPLVSDVA